MNTKRRGNRIAQAFAAIPSTPVVAEEFVQQYGVPITVLCQSKRFDTVGGGTVMFKTDKATGKLMIWREKEAPCGIGKAVKERDKRLALIWVILGAPFFIIGVAVLTALIMPVILGILGWIVVTFWELAIVLIPFIFLVKIFSEAKNG